MAATIKDIAISVGLSHQAVSYALRGSPKVAEATRQRVFLAAKDLGYRPNTTARAIRSGRHRSIGLLLSTVSKRSYLPIQLIGGLDTEAAARGLMLTMGGLPDDKLTREGFVPRLLSEWSADGLLINYQEGIPERLIQLMRAERVPSVWINTKQEAACVYADEIDAGDRAATHLLELGHKRIAFVDFSHRADELQSVHYSARDRQAGYERAMTRAGLSAEVFRGGGPVVEDNHERARYARSIVSSGDRPTGIICYSISTATHVLIQSMLAGISIPNELSVISFDDQSNGGTGILLTTMIVPQREIGVTAVRNLAMRIEEPNEVTAPVAVPFGFAAGESVATVSK